MRILLSFIGLLLAECSLYAASLGDCNILDFHAVPDGTTMNTPAIQKAIDTCSAAGGGRVVVPAGTFLTGSLCLKSHVELALQQNAVLLGSAKRSDYGDRSLSLQPPAPSVAGRASWPALIFANDASGISITGSGTIDGQGKALAEDVWQTLYGADPTKKGDRAHRADEKLRPQLIYFKGCKGVSIQDITLKSSSSWVETYDKCDGVQIRNLHVDSTAFWNNDGIDVVDSRNVTIADSTFNSADDGICLKSQDPASFCENIEITNCIVRSSASGFKIGTASLGGFRHIRIQGLYVYNTHRSVLALECVDGGFLDDVQVDGVTANNVGNAIFIRRGARRGNPGPVANISIKNLTVYYIPETEPDFGYKMALPPDPKHHNILPSSIVGLPGNDVQNVTLENIQVLYDGGGNAQNGTVGPQGVPEKPKDYPEFSMFGELPVWGLYIRHASSIHLKNVQMQVIRDDERQPFACDDVKGLEQENITSGKAGTPAEASPVTAGPSGTN
jgi:hypothetical protein